MCRVCTHTIGEVLREPLVTCVSQHCHRCRVPCCCELRTRGRPLSGLGRTNSGQRFAARQALADAFRERRCVPRRPAWRLGLGSLGHACSAFNSAILCAIWRIGYQITPYLFRGRPATVVIVRVLPLASSSCRNAPERYRPIIIDQREPRAASRRDGKYGRNVRFPPDYVRCAPGRRRSVPDGGGPLLTQSGLSRPCGELPLSGRSRSRLQRAGGPA